MLRLRMWARIGLMALFVAASTAWVTVSVTPSAYANPGTKALDPGAADPAGGGGPTAGDPDGPTGDVSPAGGASSNGNALGSGAYSSTVQSPTVGTAAPARNWPLMARFRLAFSVWTRSFLHL